MDADFLAPDLVARLAKQLTASERSLTVAESCTGGLIAAACTALAGSSAWFERGFVTYSNAAKTQLLDVPAELIAAHGAVSEAVAGAMAQGALNHSHAHIAISVTGIAGPAGGSAAKPVGTVCFGLASAVGVSTCTQHFAGGRGEVRAAALRFALELALANREA